MPVNSKPKAPSRAKPAAPREGAAVREAKPEPPLPRTLAPDEIEVGVLLDRDGRAATVKLLPKPRAVEAILTETFGRFGWSCEHGHAGGDIYCSVSVERYACARDAAELTEQENNPAKRCATSFLAAAALWGVGTGVVDLPAQRLGADRFAVTPILDAAGKTVRGFTYADRLVVDQIAYDEAGAVVAYQLRNKKGEAIVWQKA